MNIRVYFGIENLNLTNQQRNTLVAGLQQLGVNNASYHTNERNHWRIRLDNQAIIFEALFDENDLTIAAIKQRLANLFNVDVNTISHTTQQTIYGLLVTFVHGGQNKIRMIAFGHDGSSWGSWAESNLAVHVYLFNNLLAWEDPFVP
jgi:hypothetical protein